MAMKQNEADPRVRRTRQLLQDAFTSLLREKGFEAITVKDIAGRATVNRATFYAHFIDKYEILQVKIAETFMSILTRRIRGHDTWNEETIRSLFLAVCDFHSEISTMCQKSYRSFGTLFEHRVKEITKDQILSFITKDKTLRPEEQAVMNTASIMLSWGMYGAAFAWNHEGRQVPAEAFVQQSLPIVMGGVIGLPDQADRRLRTAP